jgi:hypothetical protein
VLTLRPARAEPRVVRMARLVAGIGLFAVFVHGLFYDAFLEDPIVWVFLGLAALAARESGASDHSHPA